MNPPEAFAALAKLHPIGRVGHVSDVVAGILCLESAPVRHRRDPAHRRRPERRPLSPAGALLRLRSQETVIKEVIRKAASIMTFGGVSNHPRRQSQPKAKKAQAKAAQAQAELAEVETKVAQEQATAIAKALQEDDEERRQADLEAVAEKEAEAMPDWP
jgi:hypothetical protein